MSIKEDVYEVLDEHDNIVEASTAIYKGSKAVCLYVIQLGLEHVTSRRRAIKRRELRAVIKPEFIAAPSGVTGRVILTKRAQTRIVENARELFAGWMINATISLGAATREDLLVQAENERSSAKGHIRNAELYEALADPLKPGQRADAYWTPKAVQKVKDKIWNTTEDKRPDLT